MHQLPHSHFTWISLIHTSPSPSPCPIHSSPHIYIILLSSSSLSWVYFLKCSSIFSIPVQLFTNQSIYLSIRASSIQFFLSFIFSVSIHPLSLFLFQVFFLLLRLPFFFSPSVPSFLIPTSFSSFTSTNIMHEHKNTLFFLSCISVLLCTSLHHSLLCNHLSLIYSFPGDLCYSSKQHTDTLVLPASSSMLTPLAHCVSIFTNILAPFPSLSRLSYYCKCHGSGGRTGTF